MAADGSLLLSEKVLGPRFAAMASLRNCLNGIEISEGEERAARVDQVIQRVRAVAGEEGLDPDVAEQCTAP